MASRHARPVLGATSLRAAIAALGMLAGACSQLPAPPAGQGPATALALAQRQTLETVFYRGNPLPPPADVSETAAAEQRLRAGAPWERALLETLYPADPALWALALRDTDKDGINDYRVSDYFGRFLEGDTDLDGDGIENTLDPAPYTGQPGAQASLPAHLSWRAAHRDPGLSAIQERLFEDYGIVIVDRSARFTLPLAQAVLDAIAIVYAEPLRQGPLPTLRVIAAVESSLLFADAEEGAGDFAQVFPATATMEIYRLGIDAPPLIQLGFLVHEIGHALQFAMDHDASGQRDIVLENRFPARNFNSLVSRYGWTTRPVVPDPESRFAVFRPQYLAEEDFEYLYFGETPAQWASWLDAIAQETGDDYLADPSVSSLHVLGDYSLTSPWEWYSDHVIAYVYLAMFDAVERRCGAQAARSMERAVQADVIQPAWPYFRFRNAAGDPFQDYLDGRIALGTEAAARLAERYLPACPTL